MKKAAIEQAEYMMIRAQAAAVRLNNATTSDDARHAWIDFLIALISVYSKLQTGANGVGKSQPWFGRMLKQRKDDPILNYLHHARNSADHGIEDVAEDAPGHTLIGLSGITQIYIDLKGRPNFGPLHTAPIIDVKGTIKLVPVRDTRFKDTFYPPIENFGIGKYERQLPIDRITKHAITAVAKIIDEAKTLPIN